MKFAHPLFLLLSFVPIVWCVYSFLRSSRPLGAVLKALSMAAILFALAEPSLTLPETKAAKVVLVDTSASISKQELARASSIAQTAEDNKGRNWVKIIPFDSMPRRLTPGELTSGVHLKRVGSAKATNLETALSASMAAIPSGFLPGFLLISDGNENEGSALRAVAQLRRLQIPVDTIPLGGHSNSGLHLEGVSMPHRAFSSELIPIDLTLRASAAGAATIDLSAEEKALGHQVVRLESGTNTVRVDVRIKSLGVVALSGTIRSAQLGESTFQQAIELRRARALYLSEDPPGSDANLLAALGQANVEAVRDAGQLDRDLDGFQLLILNNLDLTSLSPTRKTKIENYVKNGGGLLLIGGERQVYKENKQMDALDRALPAKLAPPETPKGTCVALIIDKSSSMEGRKIELARLSAIGVVDHLHSNDTIGVLIFDNSFQWAVPIRRAEDRSLIKRLISGITPDGGTQIAPALAEAYRRVIPSTANFKHIVLLTDGISEEGDSLELAKEAAQHAVTISTVGLGQDVNRSYLEKVAATSGGRSYFLNEPMGLEQILLKDVEIFSGTTAVEKALTPIISNKAAVLDGTGMETAPALRGYARFKAKDGSQTLLQIDSVRKDPLFVRWQYGLGRAAVFASDAKSRWAEAWIGWPGFDKFWVNVTRDLLMRTSPSEATVTFDEANGDIVVHYRLSSQATEPQTIPQIFALGPNGFRMPVNVRKTADGMYEGRVRIGTQTGLFRVRPVDESVAFPETGFYRQEPEFDEIGANENLLRMISTFTNARFNMPISDIFDSAGRSNPVQWQLWPAFLALAIGLTIAELIARKWSGLSTHFTRIRLRGA
jgi:Ca-activated chloride channel homolog